MNTPPKNETPISKLKGQNSPVFNYIDSLSPIRSVKSIPIAQTLSSLSPSSVFTSPHVASYKESLFRIVNQNSDPSKHGSTSNQQVSSIREENQKEEASIELKPLEISKNEEDGGVDLLKMCGDNVKAKSETPDWATLILDSEGWIYGSPNDTEVVRSLWEKTINSETRLSGSRRPTLKPVLDSNESKSLDDFSILPRGVRRRCLDFEMPGNNKPTLWESSSSRCAESSIGLHLNSIAVSPKDNINEYLHPVNIKACSTIPALGLHNISRENETRKGLEECPKSSALQGLKKRQVYVPNNMFALKTSRRKSEQAGERELSCKRCNCKKTKCLKLYCECFASGIYCIEPCSCVDCFNKPIHREVVLATRKIIESRNPLAFAPKVIRYSDPIMEVGEDVSKTPASARHKRGCNCKKSNCLKKYCECYQSGVGCCINCRCEGCKNAFGRKYGSLFIEQDEENETSGKSGLTKTQENVELFNSFPPPSTPMPSRQPFAELPISSNNNNKRMLLPPQYHHLHVASRSSSSGLYNNNQSFKKQDMTENVNQTPITNIKAMSMSPNSERLSLPRHLDSSEPESVPWKKNGGRKLILSSIPKFPSLTPHHDIL